jgi:hypothetical protein
MHIFFALFLALLLPLPAVAGDIYVTAEPDGRAGLFFKGSIKDGDGKKVRDALASLAKEQDVIPFVFDITGITWVEPAMEIGKALRSHQTCVTYKACTGVCILAFMGGRQRFADSSVQDGTLGKKFWHSRDAASEQHATKPNANSAYLMNWLKTYLRELRGDDRFYDYYTSVPYHKPRGLTLQEAQELGVITSGADASSQICGKPIS